MRQLTTVGDFSVRAISGTHVVLLAMNCPEPRRKDLLGFTIGVKLAGTPGKPQWLPSMKVFKSVVPHPELPVDHEHPKKRAVYYCDEHPIQSFLWGEYTAAPATKYAYTVVPMYGKPGALEPADAITFDITTEAENAEGHGVWFNRGAIASQEFADEFGNKEPTNINDRDDPEVMWLSRGLLKACIDYIHSTPAGDALRVAAYEFTYPPIIDELKAAIARGVDVKVLYHDTTHSTKKKPDVLIDGANEKAIELAGFPAKIGNRKILYKRTKTEIPHNKFIVRLSGGKTPSMVWTGSTNFTASGFLGQTNVGHILDDPAAAKQYMKYWTLLSNDPDHDDAVAGAMKIAPEPDAVIAEGSTQLVFSPRTSDNLLDWYGDRMVDATGEVMFTPAFGITPQMVKYLIAQKDILRFVLAEKPPTKTITAKLAAERDVVVSFGTTLGDMYEFDQKGEPVKRNKMPGFDLEKWFLIEEHFRKSGFIYFVHTKFLLIDPLSDDPLVCTGSANFSPNSLLNNDENMMLIRGNKRVADIYLTEFDRIYRHFYARDKINQIFAGSKKMSDLFLKENSKWTNEYFHTMKKTPNAKSFKTRRREMFFDAPTTTWADNAAARQV